MGNHKFRFSDIMPNSWLYKLKGITRRRKIHHSSPSSKFKQHSSEASSSRNPLHPSAPNASLKRRPRRKALCRPSPRLKLSSSVKPHFSLPKSSSSMFNPEPSGFILSAVTSSSEYVLSSIGEHGSSSPNLESSSCDIVIDMKYGRHARMLSHASGITSASEADDLAKSANLKKGSPALVDLVKEAPFGPLPQQKPSSFCREWKAGASGIKLRVNSPKIARKKTRMSSSSAKKTLKMKNRGTAESFAIVLSSVDPERDFRRSMVEMIVENNIREQKDLEDLLACYLSLNSNEYHDVIIKAFEKTWFHLSNSSL